jgi:hypothetical protein
MLPQSSRNLCFDIRVLRTLPAVLILQPEPYTIQYYPLPSDFPYSPIFFLVSCLCFPGDKRGLLRANICLWLSESKLCYDRLSVGQSVLVLSPHIGPKPHFHCCQLWACCYGAPTLTRGRVCRLQLLLVLASSVILGSESRGTHDYILLSQIRDSPSLEGQVPIFISPRNRVARLYPQALGSLFVASYDSQGYGGGIRTSLHAGHVAVSILRFLYIISYCIASLRFQPRKWRQQVPSKLFYLSVFIGTYGSSSY